MLNELSDYLDFDPQDEQDLETLPFTACPRCGGDKVIYELSRVRRGQAYEAVQIEKPCPVCTDK